MTFWQYAMFFKGQYPYLGTKTKTNHRIMEQFILVTKIDRDHGPPFDYYSL
jgi:hypothetical protein